MQPTGSRMVTMDVWRQALRSMLVVEGLTFPEVSICLSFCRPWASRAARPVLLLVWNDGTCCLYWTQIGNFLLFLKIISKLLPSPCQTKPTCEDFKVRTIRPWMLQDLNPSVPKGNLWKCGSHLLPHFLMSSSQTVQSLGFRSMQLLMEDCSKLHIAGFPFQIALGCFSKTVHPDC